MRVITGTARGRVLKELEGLETRPTTGKVKESLFSIIQFDIEGRRVLDLFAGTGQLGIEALSRGAAECVFIDDRLENVQAAFALGFAGIQMKDSVGTLVRSLATCNVTLR